MLVEEEQGCTLTGVGGGGAETGHARLAAGGAHTTPTASPLLCSVLVVLQQAYVHQAGVGCVKDGPVVPPASPAIIYNY